MEMNAEIKATLISIGSLDIDASLIGRLTVPTAGPGAGGRSVFFSSGRHRVRLGINPDSPLQAVADGDEIVILKGGKEFVRGRIEEELIHCPEQAYVTISERCVYDCKFCPVPKREGKIKDIEEIIGMVEEAKQAGALKAISITSGVADSPEREIERAVEAVRALKKFGVPIGVSVYPTKDSTRLLKEAGADEMKYNVETMDREIFNDVCRGLDLDFILDALREAVEVFGRNRVYSNMLIGLGESDETVEAGVEELARMGVIPILRAIGIHPLRFGEVEAERPSPQRILKLARMTREILDKYGLRADVSRTMCLPCTGCDLVPHIDI